jgi:hypothetical protein
MNIDEISYGNPNIEQLKYLSTNNYLDVLLEDLYTYTFPKNSSEATQEELNEIVSYINTLKGKDDYIDRYIIYDKYLQRYFTDGLIKGGENEDEVKKIITDIIEDTKPLLNKLKFKFQRPRPYQLAHYYKLKLFPFKSISADSPSFPSGHAFQSRLLTEVIGNLYPKTYSFMQDVFKDICYSRVYLGLHYQSDIDVGIFCADKVLKNKEFKEKYKL